MHTNGFFNFANTLQFVVGNIAFNNSFRRFFDPVFVAVFKRGAIFVDVFADVFRAK